MENKIIKNQLNLLPQYFKKVGIIVMIFTLLIVVLFIMMKSNFSESQKNIASFCSYDFFILGLSLIAFSKDKTENEMSDILRYRAMLFAIMFTIISVMLTPIINLLFIDTTVDSGREIVFTMLALYLVMYYFQKARSIKRKVS